MPVYPPDELLSPSFGLPLLSLPPSPSPSYMSACLCLIKADYSDGNDGSQAALARFAVTFALDSSMRKDFRSDSRNQSTIILSFPLSLLVVVRPGVVVWARLCVHGFLIARNMVTAHSPSCGFFWTFVAVSCYEGLKESGLNLLIRWREGISVSVVPVLLHCTGFCDRIRVRIGINTLFVRGREKLNSSQAQTRTSKHLITTYGRWHACYIQYIKSIW